MERKTLTNEEIDKLTKNPIKTTANAFAYIGAYMALTRSHQKEKQQIDITTTIS